MKQPLSFYFFRTLNELSYKYRFFASIKNGLRAAKYSLLGKTDISFVISEIKKNRSPENPIKVVFDVGAAIGDKTVIFLKEFPSATIYSFEPQIESWEKLNKRTTKLKDRVKAFSFGFLDKKDTVLMNIASYRDSSSILPFGENMADQNIKQVEIRKIEVIKMDDFVFEQNIKHIDFIKIDVEGVEKEVLQGGRETFKNIVDNVFVEILPARKGINSKDFLDIFSFFYETGFTFIGCYGDYFFSKEKGLLKDIFKK